MRAAERGTNLGAITNGLTWLLDRYGAPDPQAAIREALERDVPHPNAVRLALERRREQRGEIPPIDIRPARERTRRRKTTVDQTLMRGSVTAGLNRPGFAGGSKP